MGTVNTNDKQEKIPTLGQNLFKGISELRELTIILIIIVFTVFLTIASPNFFTASNLRSTALGFSAQGICAIGMTIALISGGFDLSVGAILGLSGILTARFFDAGINIWISAIFALIICMAFGGVNGLLIGKARINPLIVTLAMMTIVRGICYLITQGAPIKFYDAPPEFFQLGQGQFLGIPIFLIFCFGLVIIFHILMVKSSPMRKIFYTGSNEKAAQVSGINTQWVKFAVYVISAALAGIAGLLSVSRFSVAIPYAGDGIEMKVIAAAVIGGANLSGGIGTVVGSLLGVILLSLITNALILLNVSVYWQSFISGLILLVAVLIDRFNRKV